MKVLDLDDEKGIGPVVVQCFSTSALDPDIGLIVNFSPLLHYLLFYRALSNWFSLRSRKINLFWI